MTIRSFCAFAFWIFSAFLLMAKTENVIGAMYWVPGKIPRVGSLFWDVNHYGAFLAAFTCCFLLLYYRKKEQNVRFLIFLYFWFVDLLAFNKFQNRMDVNWFFVFVFSHSFNKKFGAKKEFCIFSLLWF